jgi:hypothetical protein
MGSGSMIVHLTQIRSLRFDSVSFFFFQYVANSISPKVGCHLGWHNTVCWPMRGGRGTRNIRTKP